MPRVAAYALAALLATAACRKNTQASNPGKDEVLENQAPLVEPDSGKSEDASALSTPPLECPRFEVAFPAATMATAKEFSAVVEGRRFTIKATDLAFLATDKGLTIKVNECSSLLADRYAPALVTITHHDGHIENFEADFNVNKYKSDGKILEIEVPSVFFRNR